MPSASEVTGELGSVLELLGQKDEANKIGAWGAKIERQAAQADAIADAFVAGIDTGERYDRATALRNLDEVHRRYARRGTVVPRGWNSPALYSVPKKAAQSAYLVLRLRRPLDVDALTRTADSLILYNRPNAALALPAYVADLLSDLEGWPARPRPGVRFPPSREPAPAPAPSPAVPPASQPSGVSGAPTRARKVATAGGILALGAGVLKVLW